MLARRYGAVHRAAAARDIEPAKAALRDELWAGMRSARAARFPGAEGRIPNFVGAEAAAERLVAQGGELYLQQRVVNVVREGSKISLRDPNTDPAAPAAGAPKRSGASKGSPKEAPKDAPK